MNAKMSAFERHRTGWPFLRCRVRRRSADSRRFLSVVIRSSNPIDSAMWTSCPFSNSPQPRSNAVSTMCPVERPAERGRRTLIEEEFQTASGRDSQALACVLQNRIDLSPGDARKPLQKVDHGGTALEILEESTHRHPRGTEQPFSADLARGALHRGTARPIEHGAIYSVVGPIGTLGPRGLPRTASAEWPARCSYLRRSMVPQDIPRLMLESAFATSDFAAFRMTHGRRSRPCITQICLRPPQALPAPVRPNLSLRTPQAKSPDSCNALNLSDGAATPADRYAPH